MSVQIEQKIVRLDIPGSIQLECEFLKTISEGSLPMDIAQLMNGIDGEYRLSDVESGLIFSKCVVLNQKRHHISTRNVFHDKIQIILVLEGVIKAYDPRVLIIIS